MERSSGALFLHFLAALGRPSLAIGFRYNMDIAEFWW